MSDMFSWIVELINSNSSLQYGFKIIPNKVNLSNSFACVGSTRGGTCDISSWDSAYLALFWVLNSDGYLMFYFDWKHLTLFENTVLIELYPADFYCWRKIYIKGYLSWKHQKLFWDSSLFGFILGVELWWIPNVLFWLETLNSFWEYCIDWAVPSWLLLLTKNLY